MRAAVDCGEMDLRDVREESVVENASRENPGSHGRRAILLSHTQWGEAVTIASLSPCASMSS